MGLIPERGVLDRLIVPIFRSPVLHGFPASTVLHTYDGHPWRVALSTGDTWTFLAMNPPLVQMSRERALMEWLRDQFVLLRGLHWIDLVGYWQVPA